MSRTVLEKAHSLLQRRKFSYTITLLESGRNPEIYRENFDYFLTAGLACLYLGDTGSAGAYFQRARHIRMTDPTLLCAQAALFLHRGNTDRAIEYYLDVLDYDPGNKTALNAMEFIKTHGSYDEVCKAVDTGEIEKFYPPLGINPDTIKRILLSVLAGIALAFLIIIFSDLFKRAGNIRLSSGKERADLSGLFLTIEEINGAKGDGLSNDEYKYKLTPAQIKKSYSQIKVYSTDYRENAARVEINRLLNSNADEYMKSNLKTLLSHFSEQTFDSLSNYSDNVEYVDVAKSPDLYLGCYVAWSGRISDPKYEGDSYSCNLLVGYQTMERLEGVVPVFFEAAPYPAIDKERAVTVLGQIQVKNGKIMLNGRAIYQQIKQN
ncbi:tetratricopeptide repeat protein [Treponema sp.]|uniref:tetratricopeptide repeat protein n=1 Tax=Treponema sp. TaxID=166 RepID=UPI00388EF219